MTSRPQAGVGEKMGPPYLEILVFRGGNLGFLGTNDVFFRDRAGPRNLEFLFFWGDGPTRNLGCTHASVGQNS